MVKTMKLRDFKGVFNKSTATVISVENVSADYWVIKIKPADGVNWRPGEHGIFTLPGKDVNGKKWRAFSVASIPEEGYMMIGTKTGQKPSSFKKVLTSLKSGESVNVRGPFGWFTLKDETSPVVLAAGGVGITPIRALLKELEKGNKREVSLVHASSDHHLFRDETEKLAEQDGNISVHYPRTTDETRTTLAEIAGIHGNNAYYYVSGSFGMMKSIKKTLKAGKIKGSRFIHDPFIGY